MASPILNTEAKNALCRTYFTSCSPIFANLEGLRKAGWANPAADVYFAKQRSQADTASSSSQQFFFEMMQRIFQELNTTIAVLQPATHRILDLCMAPGGFTAGVLAAQPSVRVDAICLPPSAGGHPVLHSYGAQDPRVQIVFTDITMLADEYGVSADSITADPDCHPDAWSFTSLRPFLRYAATYDLVFCDGQVLRTHKRGQHRETLVEAIRLTNAQLVFALQRIRPGGTLVMLMHGVANWDTMLLLRALNRISELTLFKPKTSHRARGSFYVVAKKVQVGSEQARKLVEICKGRWEAATFRGAVEEGDWDEDSVMAVLHEFGERLVSMAEVIWDIQAKALEKSTFIKKQGKKSFVWR